MEKTTKRATVIFPRNLWREFMVYAQINNTTASKLIRNFVRTTLNKPESEME